MAPIVLRQSPSKLEFPGATAPGVDTTHPASANLVMSAVPAGSGGQFTNLLGKPFTFDTSTGATPFPTSSVDGILGKYVYVSSLTGPCPSLTGPGLAMTTATFACIFRAVVSGSQTYQALIVTHGVHDAAFYIQAGVLDVFGASADHLSGLTVVASVPYFAVGSVSPTGINYVLKNLASGRVQTASVAGFSFTGTDAAIEIGNDNFSDPASSFIAATMYSRTYLNMQQLLQWADSPWSFWYPQDLDLADMLSIPIQVSAGLVPGLMQPRSGPGLGPNSYYISLLNAALPTQVVAVPPSGGTLPFMGVG